MKSFSKLLVAGLLTGTVAAPALAQDTADATANSTVTIIQPISIAQAADLRFGELILGTASATITIGGGADTISTQTAVSTSSLPVGRARFDVNGEAGYGFSFDADPTVVMEAQTGSGSDITVTLTESAATGTIGGTGPGLGTATAMYVGGSFTLPTNQGSGEYSGEFTATVAYN